MVWNKVRLLSTELSATNVFNKTNLICFINIVISQIIELSLSSLIHGKRFLKIKDNLKIFELNMIYFKIRDIY